MFTKPGFRHKRYCSQTIRVYALAVAGLALALIGILVLPCAQAAIAQDSPPVSSSIAFSPTGQPARWATCLTADRDGNIWVGFEDAGLWRFNPRAGQNAKWTCFTGAGGSAGPGDDMCYALACDWQGRVWAGTVNHGVSVYNGKVWKTYGPAEGSVGSHIFALAVSPIDGSVWGATEAGIFCYDPALNRWKALGRSDGLPAVQANALAFNKQGTLFVGLQADGIAIRHATEGNAYWTTVRAPEAMPNAAAGPGIPSNQINCLCVASDGTVFAGTSAGLARSSDDGANWSFVRGEDWKAKVSGLYHGPKPSDAPVTNVLLREDYVSSLADDGRGTLLVGHWRQGVEALDIRSGQRQFPAPGSDAAASTDYILALLPRADGSLFVGGYGSGVTQRMYKSPAVGAVNRSVMATANTSFVPATPPPSLPAAALPLTLSELNDSLRIVSAVQPDKNELRPKVLALTDDWLTEGDWLGRYGRYFACLCASGGAAGHLYWGSYWEAPLLQMRIGPNHDANATLTKQKSGEDVLRYWVQWVYTINPHSLELPAPFVDNRVKAKLTTWTKRRREAEVDDHGEAYPLTYDGPSIYGNLHVPHGLFYLSFYDCNKDAWYPPNARRSYTVSVWLQPNNVPFDKLELFPTRPNDAHGRIEFFVAGVWKRFLVRGPANLTYKIDRDYSINAMLPGVMLDQVDEMPPPYFETPEQWLTRTVEGRAKLRQEKVVEVGQSFVPARSEEEAANRLFDSLEDLRLINSNWCSVNGRRYYAALLCWYQAQEQGTGAPNQRLSRAIATCSYQLNLLPQWEQYQNKAGLTTARQIEQALRYKEGPTAKYDFDTVSDYLSSQNQQLTGNGR